LEKKIPILQIHGDFNLKNIMYCKNKDKIFLIDWESTRTSNAFHDFFTFIINNLKWSEVKNVINLEPKGATERHMLGVLKNKYVNWFEYDANFMRTMALITLIEKTLYYSPFLLEDAALYEAIDDIKGIYTLRRKLEL
jgi:thiamine kinase-like enzyme